MKDFINSRLSEEKLRVIIGGSVGDDSGTDNCSCTCPGEDSTKTTGCFSIGSVYVVNNMVPGD